MDCPDARIFAVWEHINCRKLGVDLNISYENYDAVYSGSLSRSNDSSTKTLDDLYMKFNTDRPQDFTGHSLSVSDIVALRQNGVVSSQYVDSVGFADVPAFLPENYLKNAEMAMEDDYDMTDDEFDALELYPCFDA